MRATLLFSPGIEAAAVSSRTRRRRAGRAASRQVRRMKVSATMDSGGGSSGQGQSGGWDPAVEFVEANEGLRNFLAFPVAFVSASNWLAQAIYVAAKLGIPDVLAGGPRAVSEIAADVGADPDALSRLMRSLAGQGPIPGIFIEVFEPPVPGLPMLPRVDLSNFPLPIAVPPQLTPDPPASELDRRYALTPLGAMLREDGTGTIRPWTIFAGEELGRGWTGLLGAVQTGRPDYGAAQGGDGAAGLGFWDYMGANPVAQQTFDESMRALSAYTAAAGEAADSYDWAAGAAAMTVVDVGGGTGGLLADIVRRTPGAEGVLFDRPSVVAESEAVFVEKGVAGRCQAKAGSFFVPGDIPAGADVYVMKNILHDWDDADCRTILRNVGAAMRPDSRLVVLEVIRSERAGYEPWTLDLADYFDLNMLVTVGGRERSAGEWRRLAEAAGMEVSAAAPGSLIGCGTIEMRLSRAAPAPAAEREAPPASAAVTAAERLTDDAAADVEEVTARASLERTAVQHPDDT
ncbi:hypothetical protein PPROV_000418100 [Pycnococcus provasolii]|uniref:O-methyltransferase domain-containing protein n=2 Tax=Pycnococcus provasolii TaxID=41880 RepID=A0A830HI18_9CHLO|nr:hypothetical protein PPROV_000418100 [Pycnococcus provasolii]|mmetsp:Transcript_14464/g.38369  ORF Transcript_14464/g.38369 Transcript_14464/m.38369 type:complete len:517 (+) Transcript_14464:275-1825(+)